MTIQEAFDFLKDSIYTVVEKLKVEVWISTEPVIYKNRYDGEHKILTEGDKWGSFFDSAWFHFTGRIRSEEHTSELQSHSFISYAVFCLKKKK